MAFRSRTWIRLGCSFLLLCLVSCTRHNGSRPDLETMMLTPEVLAGLTQRIESTEKDKATPGLFSGRARKDWNRRFLLSFDATSELVPCFMPRVSRSRLNHLLSPRPNRGTLLVLQDADFHSGFLIPVGTPGRSFEFSMDVRPIQVSYGGQIWITVSTIAADRQELLLVLGSGYGSTSEPLHRYASAFYFDHPKGDDTRVPVTLAESMGTGRTYLLGRWYRITLQVRPALQDKDATEVALRVAPLDGEALPVVLDGVRKIHRSSPLHGSPVVVGLRSTLQSNQTDGDSVAEIDNLFFGTDGGVAADLDTDPIPVGWEPATWQEGQIHRAEESDRR